MRNFLNTALQVIKYAHGTNLISSGLFIDLVLR